MTANRTEDLDTMLGDPKGAIRTMSVPLIVAFLITQVNLFADASWCSGLGVEASGGVSSIWPMYMVLMGLGTGIGVGATTSIARRLGRDDKPEADSLAVQSVVLTVLISAVAVPLCWFSLDPLIYWMGAGDVHGHCREYIDPMVMNGLILVMNGTVAGILRAEGAARKSMVMLSLSAVLNIILDPLFIYGLDMGLSGAGWATSIACLISTALGLYWYARGKMYINLSFKGFRPKLREMWDILYVGIPRASENMLISIISMVQRVFIIACGGTVAAIYYNIPWRLICIFTVISAGISAAMVPVCSAALGAGDRDKAEQGFRYTLKLSIGLLSVMMVLMFVFADYFVIPFTLSPDMAELRPNFVYIVRIYSPIVVLLGLIDVGSAILQSLRKAQVSMWSALARNIVIVIGLYIASNISLELIFWSLLLCEVFGAALMIWLAYREWNVYKRDRSWDAPPAQNR